MLAMVSVSSSSRRLLSLFIAPMDAVFVGVATFARFECGCNDDGGPSFSVSSLPISLPAPLSSDGISASGRRVASEDIVDVVVVVVVIVGFVDAVVVSIRIGSDFDILLVFYRSPKRHKRNHKVNNCVKLKSF